ncbi:MAG: hypothetical protein WDN07_04745 [Actinomycetota bacterium]
MTRRFTAVIQSELKEALIATGFSYDHDERVRQSEKIVELIPKVRDIRRNGVQQL